MSYLNILNYSQLIEGLAKYNAMVNDNKKKPNEIHISNLEQILNQFEFVLQHPDQNNLLGSIFNQLNHCDVSKCVIFRRNSRNRSKYNDKINIYELYETNDDHAITNCQLMDKIHCFCHHSYDVGNRLSVEDQNKLNQSPSNSNEPHFLTLKHILSGKYMNSRNPIVSGMKKRMCQKFQLDAHVQNEYIFGCEFDYNYDEKDQDNYEHRIRFTPRYRDLKEELTQNDICQITIDQYMNEWDKTRILYKTQCRKKHYSSISKQHLLSLMIYCNFDLLQFEFSKTYRDHSGIKHHNYYHFGRSLKEAVLHSGTH
eukprot:109650_1